MTDETETTETEPIERNCATCAHERGAECRSKRRRAWQFPEASDANHESYPCETWNGPHTCEFWEASDAHRQANALEDIATLLAILTIEDMPEDEEGEEGDEVPDEPGGAAMIQCVECPGLVRVSDSDAECPECHTCYLLKGGKWVEVDTGR